MRFSLSNLLIFLALLTSFATLAQSSSDAPVAIPPTEARIYYVDCGKADSPAHSVYAGSGFLIASIKIDGNFGPRLIFTAALSDLDDDLCQAPPILNYIERRVYVEGYDSNLERRIKILSDH